MDQGTDEFEVKKQSLFNSGLHSHGLRVAFSPNSSLPEPSRLPFPVFLSHGRHARDSSCQEFCGPRQESVIYSCMVHK